jgi:hypothetical protein
MSRGAITVRPIAMSGKDLDTFIRLPWRLYASDPAWVPPLMLERREFFHAIKNPFFEHAEVQLFLAERDGQIIGRISAQIDQLMREHMAPGIGQWGFLECEDDLAISAALIGAAESWLRARGTTQALGPISFGMWDEPGLLVDGFNTKPLLFMGHHLPYYAKHIAAAGYTGVKDMYAWDTDIVAGFPDKINRLVDIGDRNARIRIRPVNMQNFNAEVALVIDILNEAWSNNWGYTPLTPSEKAKAIKDWKPLINAKWCNVCEYDGEPVGFMITLPDLNEMIADLNGSLFPFGWAKLLWRLRKKRTKRVRVPIMGIRKSMQASKQGALMVLMMIEHIRRQVAADGGIRSECGWILDDNEGMNNIMASIGSKIYKTYRIFSRTI